MKYNMKLNLLLIFFLTSFTMMAQTVIKGKVTDGKLKVQLKEPSPTSTENLNLPPINLYRLH